MIFKYIGLFLILGGAASTIIGSIGHIRFPDVYNRAHAATKSSTIAVLITLVGALIYIAATQGVFSVQLLLGIIFVYLTNPVGSHLLLRAAYRSKVELSELTLVDELKEVMHKDEELNHKEKEQ